MTGLEFYYSQLNDVFGKVHQTISDPPLIPDWDWIPIAEISAWGKLGIITLLFLAIVVRWQVKRWKPDKE